jgi:hypothetical protein
MKILEGVLVEELYDAPKQAEVGGWVAAASPALRFWRSRRRPFGAAGRLTCMSARVV